MGRPGKLFGDSREREVDRVDSRAAPRFFRGRTGGTVLFPLLVSRGLLLGGEIFLAPAPTARQGGYPGGRGGFLPGGPEQKRKRVCSSASTPQSAQTSFPPRKVQR